MCTPREVNATPPPKKKGKKNSYLALVLNETVKNSACYFKSKLVFTCNKHLHQIDMV